MRNIDSISNDEIYIWDSNYSASNKRDDLEEVEIESKSTSSEKD